MTRKAKPTRKSPVVRRGRRVREAELWIDEWNEAHPVGTEILFWPGVREGAGRASRTRSEAWFLPSGEPVVMVEGYAGGIAISHVEARS